MISTQNCDGETERRKPCRRGGYWQCRSRLLGSSGFGSRSKSGSRDAAVEAASKRPPAGRWDYSAPRSRPVLRLQGNSDNP